MSFSKGLGFRLENIDGASAAENYDAEESLAVDSDAAAAVGEAEMVGTETEELGDAMDSSVDAAEELGTEVLPAMAEAASEDGFTPREAEQVQARLESICRRAGIDFASTGLTMRRESFGSTASRKTQTRMRLEAAEGVFAKIWENLKKAWAWLKDQLGAIWAKYTQNAEMVQKRLKDIQTRVTNLPAGSKPDKSRLKTQARFFSENREVKVDRVIASVNALDGITTGLRTTLGNNQLSNLKTAMESEPENRGKGAAAAYTNQLNASLIEPLKDLQRAEAGISRNHKVSTAAAETEITGVAGVFPSGRSLVISKTTISSGSVRSEVSKVSMEVVEDSFAEDYDAPKSPKDINDIVTKGLTMIGKLIKSDKAKAEMDAIIKGVMDSCDNNAKAATAYSENDKRSDNDVLKDSVTVRIALLRAMQTIAKTIATETPKMQFETSHALAEMAAAAVSNMKEDKK